MKNKKTFRLFISSTFNDFRREREVLQTKVFPKIKEYCSKKGYTFQPIDLRWGINEEAQLDQKTLELCLDEVRACKTNIHPNFLIMIGDRYGWVPLPYAIEVEEYKELEEVIKNSDEQLDLNYKQYKVYNDTNDEEKYETKQKKPRTTSKLELLKQWYFLDENQIPVSYILKERDKKSDYKIFENWVEEEIELKDIFQIAVNNSTLTSEQKKKYFLSATDAEVQEGIIPYDRPTDFQNKLIEERKDDALDSVDHKHIFGFFRDVDIATQVGNKFMEDDYEKAQIFKEKVESELDEENILYIQTKQIDKETLEETYLQEFEERVIKFLESQVDDQKKQEEKEKLTPLEIEQEAQRYYVSQKRKNFIGQEDILDAIDQYIASKEKEPFLIYAQSGRGKSSIMAQAVNRSSKTNIIYRFVGATPNSSSSKEILISIFDELDKKDEKEKENTNQFSLALNEKKESFTDFSYRVHSHIMNIKEDITIFIDAIDQIQNDDQFLWLPKSLPDNVKIIISALNDKNYDDTKYFETLTNKTTNTLEVKEFSSALALDLLKNLLEQENRTIQKSQEEYFLQQFSSSPSPLYISIAAQEIKNWKSDDNAQELAIGQKGIIEEFIKNLSGTYHHDERFVQKVLGYIYASRDGLSESELLQLVEVDEEFVKLMADEKFHKNHTIEFPLVHWTRLHTELNPFLNSKTQDGEELMYFFHREFEGAIKNLSYQEEKNEAMTQVAEKEHEAMIVVTQRMIVDKQNKDFDENRWGKLYITLIEQYTFRYKDTNYFHQYLEFILDINELWIRKFLIYLNDIGLRYQHNMRYDMSKISEEFFVNLSKKLYEKDKITWFQDYIRALMFSSGNYQSDEMIGLMEEAEVILTSHKSEITTEIYDEFTVMILDRKSYGYSQYTRLSENAMKLSKRTIDICMANYKRGINKEYWLVWLLSVGINYASACEKSLTSNETQTNISLMKKASNSLKEILVLLSNKNVSIDDITKGSALNSLGESYKKLYEYENEILIFKLENSVLNSLEESYKKNNKILHNAILNLEEALELRRKLYAKNPVSNLSTFMSSLKNLAHAYLLSKNHSKKKAISLLEEAKDKGVIGYEMFQNNYAKLYTDVLYHLGSAYILLNESSRAMKILKEALRICEKHKLSYDYNMVNQLIEKAKEKDEQQNLNSTQKGQGRNDPCSCGSSKKYKKCCGKN